MTSRERSFFLRRLPDQGGPELHAEDEAHARRVLRLRRGDEIIGLDGRGTRWPLRLTPEVGTGLGQRLGVELAGPARFEPAPGEPGAALPWIEVAVALPREKRAEAMLGRLVQLGLAALTPLAAERSQGPRASLSEARRGRLERAAREACKQCGRAWLPEIGGALRPGELARARSGCPLALLAPGAAGGLQAWAGELDPAQGTRERPIVLVVGPEGGLTPAEEAELEAAGARPVRVGPHVLRIETAAEAGLAGLVQACWGTERD